MPAPKIDHVADTIVGLLRNGLGLDNAARAVGVKDDTVREWIRRGEDRDGRRRPAPKYVDFARRVREARAQGEGMLVGQMWRHARDDWRATAWLLERLYPDRYGIGAQVRAQVEAERDALQQEFEARLDRLREVHPDAWRVATAVLFPDAFGAGEPLPLAAQPQLRPKLTRGVSVEQLDTEGETDHRAQGDD